VRLAAGAERGSVAYPGGQVGTDVTSADRVQVPTPGRQTHVVTPEEFGALSRLQQV
jgi:hypothetical protein